MSRALAVFHGHFGRATVYQLNRPFNVHAHREGHLIFHVGGTPGCIEVLDHPWPLREDTVVAVNPWEPHNFLPNDLGDGALFFVLTSTPSGSRGSVACVSGAPNSGVPPPWTEISGRRQRWFAALPRSTVSTGSCGT